MPLNIMDQGSGNRVDIHAATRAKGNGTIIISGNDNVISIAESTYNFGVYFTIGDGCQLTIGKDVNCLNLVLHMAKQGVLTMGDTIGFNGIVRLQMHEPGALTIGSGCLFADQVEISISDMHSIVDATTRQRLNPARDVVIGNKVWIGNRAMVMKGVKIGDGAVIGAMSVVTRDVPDNTVAVGNPARVVRENASWDFNLL